MEEAKTQRTAGRPVRRRERELTRKQALEVASASPFAVLSTCDADGSPYGIPVSPVLDGEERIYFHSTAVPGGRKTDNLAINPRVSLAFVGKALTVPRLYTIDYASAVISGRASLVADEAEKARAMVLLLKRYAPDNSPARNAVQFRVRLPAAAVWRIDVEHIAGKARAAERWEEGKTLFESAEMPEQEWLRGIPD